MLQQIIDIDPVAACQLLELWRKGQLQLSPSEVMVLRDYVLALMASVESLQRVKRLAEGS